MLYIIESITEFIGMTTTNKAISSPLGKLIPCDAEKQSKQTHIQHIELDNDTDLNRIIGKISFDKLLLMIHVFGRY